MAESAEEAEIRLMIRNPTEQRSAQTTSRLYDYVITELAAVT
jgi:hypothetical protein